ncbi:ferredoxin reductase-like protein [Tuber magnatum]|uniref:Ferredoxin reductase-like protein n=1 Tax=Tuber magnatum TaxID=42249 RepID=A0A317SSU0_9PEZI|nr:ferredoxin reductase-like protein [Tuber magnatum]
MGRHGANDTTSAAKDSSFGSQYLQNLYYSFGVLVLSTALLGRVYVPHVVLVALVIGGFQVLKGHGPRKVLKADKWQGFRLVGATALPYTTGSYKLAFARSRDVLGLPIGQHIQFSAKISGAIISKHIASLKVGQSIKTRGPKGQFVYRPRLVRAFGMITGGAGLAPMLQIFRAIIRNPEDKAEVDFIFANVNLEDPERIATFESTVLNNPPEGWKGGVRFVTEKYVPAPAAGIRILLCGPPPPMVSAMKKATAALGYEPAKPVSRLLDQVFSF